MSGGGALTAGGGGRASVGTITSFTLTVTRTPIAAAASTNEELHQAWAAGGTLGVGAFGTAGADSFGPHLGTDGENVFGAAVGCGVVVIGVVARGPIGTVGFGTNTVNAGGTVGRALGGALAGGAFGKCGATEPRGTGAAFT